MILTEADAKKKICHVNIAAQSRATDWWPYNCVGSECMAWSWYDSQYNDNPRGYCGLKKSTGELP